MSNPINQSPRNLYAGLLMADMKRDVYEVAGYPVELTFEALHATFRRNAFAQAVIMKPVDRCWSSFPKVYDCMEVEGEEPKASNSQFEKDVEYLKSIGLFEALRDLAWRRGVGRYGGIVIVSRDIKANSSSSDKATPMGVQSIVGFRPVFEGNITEASVDTDISTMEFGNPITFNFNPGVTSTGSNTANVNAVLHRSRVFAFSENSSGGSIYGTSILEPIFNPLLDAQKLCAAAAEGHWKNARQRLHINISDEQVASAMFNGGENQDKQSFNEKMASYAAGFDSELLTAGMDVQTLQSSLMEPGSAFDIAMQFISAGSSIPKTVLVGFETGERSSEENAAQWDETCNSRRLNIETPMIKACFNHLIKYGFMSAPESGMCICWDDLTASSEFEKVKNADAMASVNQKLFASGQQPAFTSEEVREAAGYESSDDYEEETEQGELEDGEIEDETETE